MRRSAGEIAAVHQHSAGPWPKEPHDRRDGRGLARAVPADERDGLARPHREVDALQHVALAVVRVQAADLERRGHAVATAFPR